MPYYNYYRKGLDPSLWSWGTNLLLSSVRNELLEQIELRFPFADRAFVVGPITTNYWEEDTPFDVLLCVPRHLIKQAKKEASLLNGKNIIGKYFPDHPVDHRIFWFFVPNVLSTRGLVRLFGKLFDIFDNLWIGPNKTLKNQYNDAESIMTYINWATFRERENMEELYPNFWTLVFAWFSEITPEERQKLLEKIHEAIKKLDVVMRKRLKNLTAESWKKVEVGDLNNLPPVVAKDYIQQTRLADLLERLIAKKEKLEHTEQMQVERIPLPLV